MSARPFQILAALALAGAAAAAAAAAVITGSGRPAAEERDVSGFTALAVSVPARVDVVHGGREGVRVAADDNVLAAIESVVEDGVLQLRLRDDTRLRDAGPIHVTVRANILESIAIAGSGEVRAPQIDAERLAVRVTGSGAARVGGRAGSLEVRISGSGDVRAGELATPRASVSIAGSGDATVAASERLQVRVSGSGDVRYYGDPAIEKSVIGSGQVRRLGALPT